jgi:hypothetical protein
MAIAFVNSGTASDDASGTTLTTSAQNVTAGNLLVGCLEFGTAAVTLQSVADTAGNTWNTRPLFTAANNNKIQVFYAFNVLGNASNQVTTTLTGTGASFRRSIIHQYSGALTSNPFDVDIPGADGASGTTLTSGSFTPSEANEMAVVFVSDDDGISNVFSSGTYTLRISALANDTGSGDRLNPGLSSQTAVFTQSVNVSWRIIGATFKQAAGAPASFDMCPGNGYFWRSR